MSNQEKGKLTVVFSGMFGGKTTYLIKEEYEDGGSVLAVKPAEDNRYGESAELIAHVNHDEPDAEQLTIPAKLINSQDPKTLRAVMKLHPEIVKLLIDEGMLLVHAYIGLINEFLDEGIDVVVAGLDKTSELASFGIIPELIEVANECVQCFAVCDGCGGDAELSYAKFTKKEVVVIGGTDMYGAACWECHPDLHKGTVVEGAYDQAVKRG